MFSSTLATASAVVPASHAGGNSETSRAARPPPSRPRCTRRTLRMYAASRSPRSARASSRIASSSRPMASRSSGVRCSRSVVLMGRVLGELEVDLDGARRGGDAGADHLAVGVLDVAGAQVAYGAGAQAPDARVADAHAAAVGE